MITLSVAKELNPSKLNEELRVAFGAGPELGVTCDPAAGVLNVEGVADTSENRATIDAVLLAHDHTQQSQEDIAVARINAARAAVDAADITAIKTGAANSDMPPLAQHVEALAQVVADLCEALGFTPTVPLE